MERAGGGNRPRFGNCQNNVAWIVRRGREGKSVAVPVGLGVGKMESAAARQPQLERGEWLIAIVAEVIDRINVNGGRRTGDEANLNFLFRDGIAGAERCSACGGVNARGKRGRKQETTRP